MNIFPGKARVQYEGIDAYRETGTCAWCGVSVAGEHAVEVPVLNREEATVTTEYRCSPCARFLWHLRGLDIYPENGADLYEWAKQDSPRPFGDVRSRAYVERYRKGHPCSSQN